MFALGGQEKRLMKKLLIAIIVLIVLGIGGFFYLGQKSRAAQPSASSKAA